MICIHVCGHMAGCRVEWDLELINLSLPLVPFVPDAKFSVP